MQHGFALKAIIKKTINMTYRDIQYMCACTDKTVSPEYEFNIKMFPLKYILKNALNVHFWVNLLACI